MDEKKAREILGECIQEDGGLYSLGWYLNVYPGDDYGTFDGKFSAEQLKAIIWWMENYKPV